MHGVSSVSKGTANRFAGRHKPFFHLGTARRTKDAPLGEMLTVVPYGVVDNASIADIDPVMAVALARTDQMGTERNRAIAICS